MNTLKNLPDHLQVIKTKLLSCSSDCRGGDGCKGQQCEKGAAGIPVTKKLCYAVGGVPYQMTAVAMGISLQIFLLDVVQMEAFYVSMILFVSRAWDAVTDPLVGYLVSRSRWTPIGKLIPWVVLSMPFGVLSYVLLWFMPRGAMSQAFSVPWFLATACLFETLMSCYNVPYLSLNMFLGGDQKDRDSATAFRMSVEMMAMLVASVMQGQVVAVYNTESEGACQQLALDAPENTPSPHTASLQATRKAFLTSALVMGAIFFLCCLVLFLGVKEQQVLSSAPSGSQEIVQVSYFTSLKMLACHVPYQRLVLGFLFSALAFQMSLGNFALFCSHAAGHGAQFQHLLLVLLAAAMIAVPLWQAVLVRIGKKTTVFIGLSLFIPAVIVIACVPSSLPVFMTMCVLMGFSLATMFLLPWSMLPDVVDDFAVRNPSCKGLEPMFFSCYAFCNKLGGGLSVGISTLTLHFVGYRAGACSHDESVATALVVLFSPVPIALLLVGLLFFRFYSIDERQRAHVQTLLTTVHGDVPSSDREDDVQQQTRLQQPQSTVRTSFKSHPAMKPAALHKSKSLPPRHHHRKCSIKSNNVSNNKSKSLSVGNIRLVSAGRSSAHPPRHKGRVHQHSWREKQSDGCPEHDHGCLSSSMSHVRSQVTWV